MVDQSSSASVPAKTLPGQGLNIAFTVLSFLGASVAGALWLAHAHSLNLPCTANGDCEDDWNSAYGYVDLIFWHQVPVALTGLIAYIVLLTIGMAKYGAESVQVRRALAATGTSVALFGCLYSWYLQYAAIFKLGHFCPWCFSSAVIITSIVVVSIVELRKLVRKQ